jgi:hypothetical protein
MTAPGKPQPTPIAHPSQRWLTVVDGDRLRQLRRQQHLSQDQLAANGSRARWSRSWAHQIPRWLFLTFLSAARYLAVHGTWRGHAGPGSERCG